MGEVYVQRKHLEYPELTMFQMLDYIAKEYPDDPAYEFYGKRTKYSKFIKEINKVASSLIEIGANEGDAVTICLPNIPQALESFYAVNRIGAVANMIHPLSAQKEITFYLNIASSNIIITVDMFYEKVKKAVEAADHDVTIVLVRMQDKLPRPLSTLFVLKKGRSYLKYPEKGKGILYTDMIKKANLSNLPEIKFDRNKTATILYSGGTSGTPKGICLTDYNFNALALQAREAIGVEFHPGLTILSCMPMFHGFGLGINIHTTLIHGVCCILMPTFTSQSYGKMLVKKKPNFIAGVPTIFEALLHLKELEGADLSFLKGMYCGGDSLSIELKRSIDTFLKEHGASIQVREGYGLTECVTASCLTPRDEYREGSIGIPFPDTSYAIVTPDTDDVLEPGVEGEIIIKGPTVMLGYLNNKEETDKTLRKLKDGNTWLYTGDLGMMDEDGYVYFKQRIKRMIITNGYNVYPGQIENILDGMPEIAYSCVIGVKDTRRMQRVRAYVVLNDGVKGDDQLKGLILHRLKKSVAGYALPREIEFKDELPKTLVGKIAFRQLEEEANLEEDQKLAMEMQNQVEEVSSDGKAE